MKPRYEVYAKVGGKVWAQAWETNDYDEARHVRTIILAGGDIKNAKIVDTLNMPWYQKAFNYAVSLIL